MIAKKHATGRTASGPAEVESASAHDFPSDRVGISARWIDHGPARQGTEPILTPLEDIAHHVVQSPRIGKFPPNRVNGETVVHGLPRVILQAGIIGIIPVTEPRGSAGARGAFPLSLCRKTVLAAGGNASRREFPLGPLRAVVGRLGPAHAGNRSA